MYVEIAHGKLLEMKGRVNLGLGDGSAVETLRLLLPWLWLVLMGGESLIVVWKCREGKVKEAIEWMDKGVKAGASCF